MVNLKKLLSLALCLILVFSLLAACASNKPAPDSKPAADNTPAAEQEDEEMATISFWSMISNGSAEDVEYVEQKINEITEPTINTHIEYTLLEGGNYGTSAGMALSSGEPIDVFVRGFGPMGFTNLMANNQLLNIEPYMDKYGANLKELCGSLLDCFRMNGGLYAVPAYRVLNQTGFIGMRKDILEELGMLDAAQKMTTWSDFEKIMDAVVDKYGADGMYPIALAEIAADGAAFGSEAFADTLTYDYCGDTARMVCGLDDGTIECVIWNKDMIAQFERFADWTERGYVWPDSPYDDHMASDLVKNGISFCEIFSAEVGAESAKKASTGYDYFCFPIVNCPMGSDNVNKFGLGVNIACEEPEAAVKFMDLMYSNADLMNLLCFGVEGEHYKMYEDGMADFPTPGELSSTKFKVDEFFFGNQFLLKPWAGTSPDFRETSKASFATATTSRYLGFALQAGELQDTIAAITAVTDQYQKSINTGLYTPEMLAEYQDKLKVAGIDAYVEEIRTQVAAWEASK